MLSQPANQATPPAFESCPRCGGALLADLCEHDRQAGVADEVGKPARPLVDEIDLADRAAAVQWIINNQKGRRNLPELDVVKALRPYREQIAAKAKEKMSDGGGDKKSASARSESGLLKSANPIKTREAVAEAAGMKLTRSVWYVFT